MDRQLLEKMETRVVEARALVARCDALREALSRLKADSNPPAGMSIVVYEEKDLDQKSIWIGDRNEDNRELSKKVTAILMIELEACEHLCSTFNWKEDSL